MNWKEDSAVIGKIMERTDAEKHLIEMKEDIVKAISVWVIDGFMMIQKDFFGKLQKIQSTKE